MNVCIEGSYDLHMSQHFRGSGIFGGLSLAGYSRKHHALIDN